MAAKKPLPPVKKERRKFKILSSSRRLTLTYVVFFVWVALAIIGMVLNTNLTALAVYFTSGLPVILGYLWAETSRPSASGEDSGIRPPTGEELAQILASMQSGNQNQNQGGNPWGGGNQWGGHGHDDHQPQQPSPKPVTYQQPAVAVTNTQTDMMIYSDDQSTQLKITSLQLATLQNSGYITFKNGKYIFPSNLLETIKALIGSSSSEQDPSI